MSDWIRENAIRPVVTAEGAYLEWGGYVRVRVLAAWGKWGRDKRVEIDDLLGEAWCRIVRYWPSVEGARWPKVMCGELASQAVTQVMIKIAGRSVMARGKLRRWGEKPPMGSLDGNALRTREISSPVLRAIIREEVVRHPELKGEWFLEADSELASESPTEVRPAAI